jgi:outer membrane lipoprotein-sorting protein
MAAARQDDVLNRKPKFRAAVGSAARSLRAAGTLIVIASMTAAAATSSAQTVPVPKPAPKARGNPQVTDAKGPATTGATQVAPPTPIIPDPRRNVPTSIFQTFDTGQKAQAAKVSAYLSSLQTLVGNFIQVGPDGTKTQGDFYIQKPGKVRFEYNPPTPIDIIADGSSVVVRDRNLATQDVYPLSQTPLRYLLSDRIDLLKDTNVVGITADDLYVTITIEEKQALIGTSRLMLMLSAKDGQLKQWTVTDPQGYDTTVAVYNLDSSKKIDPGLFKIDWTAYPGAAPG